MTAIAQHQALTVEHGSPHEIVELARSVMGSIECDPCSSGYWNDHVVKASFCYEEDSDVLNPERVWKGSRPEFDIVSFFINPPGGLVKEFWRFATARWLEGSAVFFVGFNLDQLAYLQREGAMFRGFRRAILPRRLAFLRAVEGGPPVPATSPTRNNYLLLMPSEPEQVARFDAQVKTLGSEPF